MSIKIKFCKKVLLDIFNSGCLWNFRNGFWSWEEIREIVEKKAIREDLIYSLPTPSILFEGCHRGPIRNGGLFDDVHEDDIDHNVKGASLTSVYLGMLVVSSRSGGGLEPRRLCSTSLLLPRERNLPREATNSPTVNTRDGKHTRCPLIWSSRSWPWEEGEIITEPFHINSLNVIIWGFLVIQKLSHCHIVIVIVICNCMLTIALRTPQNLCRIRYQKTKPNCIVSYSFSTAFFYYEQEV